MSSYYQSGGSHRAWIIEVPRKILENDELAKWPKIPTRCQARPPGQKDTSKVTRAEQHSSRQKQRVGT